VESLLGTGGSGAVYLVSDRHTRQNVFALKEVIDPSGQDRKRLLFEYEVLKWLDHRALPHVYRVFEHAKLKRIFLLMEYIQGKDLETLRKEQPKKRFPLKLALAILSPVVDALIYLHHQEPPIVHRDIKPANIIVPMDGNEAVLVDFGTAKEYLPERTTTGFRHGSPGFAPLEQYSIRRSSTDLRADVYGLGATLYTLLTGVIPIDAVTRIMSEKGGDPLKPVIALVPDIPLQVNNAIQRALSIYKQDRFATMEAFWHALHADSIEQQEREPKMLVPDTPLPPNFDQDEESIETAPSAPWPNKQRNIFPPRRGRLFTLFFALVLSLALGSGLLGVLLYGTRSAPSHPGPTSVPRSVLTAPPVSTTPSTPTTLPTPSLYPPLAPSYAGTISDIAVANKMTKMYLAQIRQDQSSFHGYFQGLGLVGPFTGTVTSSGKVHFTVKIDSGMLIFNGAIKVGGDIEGAFSAVDQQGRSLGEYGPWYISTASSN